MISCVYVDEYIGSNSFQVQFEYFLQLNKLHVQLTMGREHLHQHSIIAYQFQYDGNETTYSIGARSTIYRTSTKKKK